MTPKGSNKGKKGFGIPLTEHEIELYEKKRAIGWSVEEAAIFIGRGKSTMYAYEKNRDKEPPARAGMRTTLEKPSRDLSDSIAYVQAVANRDTHKAVELENRFGRNLLLGLSRVALYLANVQAENTQHLFSEIGEGAEWAAEVEKIP